MSAESNSSPARWSQQYNPCDEPDNPERVAAANWELLRRIPAFQVTARKWTADPEFRHQHVTEKGAYAANEPARCALDWMLTPTERIELAEFQKSHRLLFTPNLACQKQAEWNFGPIVIEYDWEAHDGWLSDSIDKIVRIQPAEWDGRLILETGWKDAPSKFKQQFRQTTIGGFRFERGRP